MQNHYIMVCKCCSGCLKWWSPHLGIIIFLFFFYPTSVFLKEITAVVLFLLEHAPDPGLADPDELFRSEESEPCLSPSLVFSLSSPSVSFLLSSSSPQCARLLYWQESRRRAVASALTRFLKAHSLPARAWQMSYWYIWLYPHLSSQKVCFEEE